MIDGVQVMVFCGWPGPAGALPGKGALLREGESLRAYHGGQCRCHPLSEAGRQLRLGFCSARRQQGLAMLAAGPRLPQSEEHALIAHRLAMEIARGPQTRSSPPENLCVRVMWAVPDVQPLPARLDTRRAGCACRCCTFAGAAGLELRVLGEEAPGFEALGGLPGVVRSLREVVLMPLLYPHLLAHLHVDAPRCVHSCMRVCVRGLVHVLVHKPLCVCVCVCVCVCRRTAVGGPAASLSLVRTVSMSVSSSPFTKT